MALSERCTWETICDICFPATIPENVEAAIASLNAFYACGETNDNGGKAPASPPYSFIADADAILAAFAEHYHIDLLSADMHWWTFRALLNATLGDTLQRRIEYRCADTSGIKDSKRRAHYARMRERYALQSNGKKQYRPQTLAERDEMWLNGGTKT